MCRRLLTTNNVGVVAMAIPVAPVGRRSLGVAVGYYLTTNSGGVVAMAIPVVLVAPVGRRSLGVAVTTNNVGVVAMAIETGGAGGSCASIRP